MSSLYKVFQLACAYVRRLCFLCGMCICVCRVYFSRTAHAIIEESIAHYITVAVWSAAVATAKIAALAKLSIQFHYGTLRFQAIYV